MSDKQDYKNTLNLPKTAFPMKAQLAQREPGFLKSWQEDDIYKQILRKSQGKDKYILHDGPPYANGDIHIGHVLNKTLKDIVVKYKTMQGFDSPYVPGWDCHGLPVEHQLFKELGISKYQIDQLNFRKKARNYALKYVTKQKEQFKRLGVFGDWENPYLTLSPEYEEVIIDSLKILCEKGYVDRGLKPVNWCFRCETALAEAEVEYNNHTSPSIYVKFKLDPHKDYPQDSYLVIWTTTPWTLLANVAVALHPKLKYSYIKTDKGNLIVASDLLSRVLDQSGAESLEVIREIEGSKLEGLTYQHPFGIRKGRVVLADYVSREEGTGLVHTAPGHGAEDYATGLKYKLDVIMPVDEKGKFDNSAGDFSGMNVFEANQAIIEKLTKQRRLLFQAPLTHSYPHCWRCKQPVIFRATKQWFLLIDKDNLRDNLISAIEHEVRWVPSSGRERISAMVKLRPDWCISRQRYWGVPIPSVKCTKCKEETLDPVVIENFKKFVAKESSDAWFQHELSEFLPKGFKCPHCQGNQFVKGEDILDVWFDSGVSHQAVLKKRKELGGTPCALYLEGSDQHRGWFQSSLIPSMCIDDKPPYKEVLTHGFVVDGSGRKMSKSLGNVISPFDVIKHYGADILRMWVASSDYNDDIRISEEILARLSEAYRKIRNTIRFSLSNLYDFDPDKYKVDYRSLEKIDKWILKRLQWRIGCITAGYEDFNFHHAFKNIYDLCNINLSMFYLDRVKGRLYTYAKDSPQRRSAQTAIYEILQTLVRLIAPILVFTAEETWQHMPKDKKSQSISSVHLLKWPEINTEFKQDDLERDKKDIETEFRPAIKLKPEVEKILEEKRNQGLIGSPFDAQIKLLTKTKERYKVLVSLKPHLCEVFKVSQVEVEEKENFTSESQQSSVFSDIAIEASKASGTKCIRCWNYSDSVGVDKTHPLICDNCLKAV